jgi:hypothetical protein
MARRESKWTHICWDVDPADKTLKPYVRFTPDMVDLERAGFSWGLSIGGGFHPDEAAAVQAANMFDKFFDCVYEDLKQDWIEEQNSDQKAEQQ